jgi:membrane-bound lytic murein transglycosylase D
MRNALLLVLFNLMIITSTFAQEVVADSVVVDSLEVAVAEEEILYKEDSTDFVYYFLPGNNDYIPGDDDPALIKDRLSCIDSKIPLIYNENIQAFINYFTVRDREYTRMVMRRKHLYFPIFEKYLKQYGLPDELKYLSIIESGLNPRAVSRVRAVGLWQFMSATGKYFGLNNDYYIDERMDPEMSTDAACRYLKSLYGMFGNWELALAAYNTGPGNVKRAIRKSGYKHSFWEVYSHLPRETRSYVPQFMAMIYTMNYLEAHNLFVEDEEMPMSYDTLQVDNFVHLETFAKLTGTCMEDLQKLNPSLLHNAVPERRGTFILSVPPATKLKLNLNRLAILDSASKVGRKEIEVIARNTPGNTYGRDKIVYKVRRGDVLGSIAMRHHVRVEDLRKWNNIRGNSIRAGQHLAIWTKGGGRSSSVASSSKSSKLQFPSDAKTYVVQPGDTLWTISQKSGLPVSKIKSLNNLSNTKIQPGQKLIVGI